MNLFPKLGRSNHDSDAVLDVNAPETDEEREERRKIQRIHDRSKGPQKVRFMTNGQVRRQAERSARAEHRKTNRRFRRNWMANQQAIASLRGQVDTVGKKVGSPALQANAMAGLRGKFRKGDVVTDSQVLAAARQYLAEVTA